MRAYIPTPATSYFSLGPFKLHFYAICIVVGIVIALFVGRRRYSKNPELLGDLALYAVPAGVIGGRLYHVLTTPERYFNSNFINIFKIWDGGMGIWGAIFLGALAALYRLKKLNLLVEFYPIADALAPGILFAQAIGRLGNWFNGELFGKPTTLPWAVEIPISNRPSGYETFNTYHPTFLYESLWCLAIGIFLLKRKSNGSGEIFWSYIWLYSLGRLFIEMLRIDYSHRILGMRFNIFVAITFILLGVWQNLKIKKRAIG